MPSKKSQRKNKRQSSEPSEPIAQKKIKLLVRRQQGPQGHFRSSTPQLAPRVQTPCSSDVGAQSPESEYEPSHSGQDKLQDAIDECCNDFDILNDRSAPRQGYDEAPQSSLPDEDGSEDLWDEAKAQFKNKMSYVPQMTIDFITNVIKSATPENWDASQAALLECFDGVSGAEHLSPDSTSKNFTKADTPVERLKFVLPHVVEMLSIIPNDRLDKYKAEMTAMCSTESFTYMNLEQRLYGFARVLYAQEDGEALITLDWDSLEAAVRACAVLAECTGPIEEKVDQSLLDDWVECKLRDIRLLEKLLGSKRRINGIAPGPPPSAEASVGA